jgi:RNA polymerase sigma-70 factor, ECF subfamily
MTEEHDSISERVDGIYRTESRRILATLIKLLGDFDLAEEALQNAFAAAVGSWPRDGIPVNPRAWLVSTGRFKAVDVLRRRARFDAMQTELAKTSETTSEEAAERPELEDDRLRLIFVCCHPALPPDAQIALTLREVCGLTTEEIARAHLTTAPTVAQRIVRAKAKIRDAKIPYEVPSLSELPERLEIVLHVVYLIFNEGYSASSGDQLTRTDLTQEAIRLTRLLMQLLPEPDSEATGLLALMLLHESRRATRLSAEGDVVLLEDQDRSLWNQEQITEGVVLVRKALATRNVGAYTLQAAIAAVHAEAPSSKVTDWNEIVGLYDLLLKIEPSPVVELNRAVAVAMRDGEAVGLRLIDDLLARGELQNYSFAHAGRAELYRRLGRTDDARQSYERALQLMEQEPERRFIQRRLKELAGGNHQVSELNS